MTTHEAQREQDELAEYAGMSIEAKWQELMSLLRLTSSLLAANDRAREALDYQEERSPESLALWQRLMAKHRDG